MTSLAQLTTMRVGGVPAELSVCRTRDELVAKALNIWSSGQDWLLLGGGSNLVVADEVPELHVISVQNTGIQDLGTSAQGKRVFRVQAGENWDSFVAFTVSQGLSGIEAMSGIPGSVGAGPVQNIGAYAQELSQVLTQVEFLDYETHQVSVLSNLELGFGYRDSAIKRGKLGLITWVEFELANNNGLSAPLESTQIAADLQVPLGTCVPVIDVRNSVLKLRASKGMVLSALDQDSVSCGSFFTNPIVSDRFARTLPSEAPRWETPEDDGLTVKLSAAWLIENAGIPKGFSLPGSKAAISSKHTLAITNRGGATAQEIRQLAEFVQARVSNQFGILLQAEPNLVGF